MSVPVPKVFFDANVLVSACLSVRGPAYQLIQLSERGLIRGYASMTVVEEARRAIAEVAPEAAFTLRRILGRARLRVRKDARVRPVQHELAHPGDLHVVAAALRNRVDFLATFNIRDFRGHILREHYGLVVIHPSILLRSLGGIAD